jgi:hypothetical protein
MTPAQRALSMQGTPSNIQVTPSIERQASQPAAQAHDEPTVAPKRAAVPLVVVGLLALVGLGVGAFVVLGNDSPKPTPPPVVEPLKPVAVVEPVKPVEPVKTVEPAEVAALDAGPAVAAVARARLTPKGTVFKVIRRSDGAFIDLERGQRLREGDRLRLVGEPIDGKEREVFGQARVLELKARGTVAELLMEEDDAHPDALFAFVDETVPDRPKVERVTKEPAMVPAQFPATKDPTTPVKPDGAPGGPELNPVVAVKPVEVKPVEVKPVDTKPAAPTLPRIEGTVIFTRKNGVFGPSTTVRVVVNSETPSGTRCDVHLPNGLHQVFSTLRPRDSKESDLSAWKRDPRPDPNKARDWSLVECDDAVGYFKYTALIQR